MVPYRALKPQTERHKSPRKAARERIAPEVERLTGEAAPGLPPRPTKLQQLEALVRAGRVADPLATAVPQESAGFRVRASGAPRNDNGGSLLQRVQHLYEQTVVPVREIARLAGVSERTLYKYVARYGWTRRHVCLEREDAVRAANRGRSLTPRQGSPHEAVARAKGAGGRFIAFEERGTPQPRGPKALDPLAAQAAGEACERAALLSDIAVAEAVAKAAPHQADARAARETESKVRALANITRTLRELTRIAMADDKRDAQERAERERRRVEQQRAAAAGAEAERRTEALRADLMRKLDAMAADEWDGEGQEAEAARVKAQALAEVDAMLADRDDADGAVDGEPGDAEPVGPDQASPPSNRPAPPRRGPRISGFRD
jgi:hypothetical protein